MHSGCFTLFLFVFFLPIIIFVIVFILFYISCHHSFISVNLFFRLFMSSLICGSDFLFPSGSFNISISHFSVFILRWFLFVPFLLLRCSLFVNYLRVDVNRTRKCPCHLFSHVSFLSCSTPFPSGITLYLPVHLCHLISLVVPFRNFFTHLSFHRIHFFLRFFVSIAAYKFINVM